MYVVVLGVDRGATPGEAHPRPRPLSQHFLSSDCAALRPLLTIAVARPSTASIRYCQGTHLALPDTKFDDPPVKNLRILEKQ